MKTRCVSCEYRNKGVCVLTNLSMVLDDPCVFITMPETIRNGIVDKHRDMLNRSIQEVDNIKKRLAFINEYVEKAKEFPPKAINRPDDYFKINDEIAVVCENKWYITVVRAKNDRNIVYVVDGVDYNASIYSPMILTMKEYDYFAKNNKAFDDWYSDNMKTLR